MPKCKSAAGKTVGRPKGSKDKTKRMGAGHSHGGNAPAGAPPKAPQLTSEHGATHATHHTKRKTPDPYPGSKQHQCTHIVGRPKGSKDKRKRRPRAK